MKISPSLKRGDDSEHFPKESLIIRPNYRKTESSGYEVNGKALSNYIYKTTMLISYNYFLQLMFYIVWT